MERELTPEQRRAAVETLDRDVFLEAGAGTGKTGVLVRRYCEALRSGEGPEAILAFTFTERAAAELRRRIREEVEDGAAGEEWQSPEAARGIDAAWISTIHGFCRRILTLHPVAAGIDPRSRVIDEAEAARLAEAAFERALEEFLADGDLARAELVAAFRAADLGTLIVSAHDELRSRGSQEPQLPQAPPLDPGAALAAAVAAAGPALDEARADGGKGGRRIDEDLERIADVAALTGRPDVTLAELERLAPQSDAKRFRGPAGVRYRDAFELALAGRAAHERGSDYEALRELLSLFGGHYRNLKDTRGGLDFEDLQLQALRLLRETRAIGDSYRGRFRHILVDEFQDTNRLQLALIGQLRGPDTRLFVVGDEFQSVYRFRHADPEVFRAERERFKTLPASDAEPLRLTGNFRSRPEILAVVNSFAGSVFDDFGPLTVGAEPEESGAEDTVDVLVTPTEAWPDDSESRRLLGLAEQDPARIAPEAEARFLARHLRESGVTPGRTVVLLRAFTHLAAFEDALEREGLNPYVIGGRGYWSAQQVEDVREMLASVANPLEDQALFSVLASPFCGARPDTLWLLRRLSGPGMHIWPTLADPDKWVQQIDPVEGERLRRFLDRFGELREAAPLLSLEGLVERAVESFGYDLAVLAKRRGARRIANLRKLGRLAREFEAAEGRDLRAFVEQLRRSAERDDRQAEAATEAEEHDGVRLMTVHAAKGLEFDVVAVADLGRPLATGAFPSAIQLHGTSDGEPETESVGIGLRLARLGQQSLYLFDYRKLRDQARAEDSAEDLRLAHVAATRARRKLILSGQLAKDWDRERADAPALACFLRTLGGDLEDGEVTVPAPTPRPGLSARFDDGRLSIRVNRREGWPGTPPPSLATAPAVNGARAGVSPPLARPAPPPEAPAGYLSFSALSLYRRCGYRFYAERVLGLADAGPEESRAETRERGLAFGSAVHALLEWSARHGWRQPELELCELVLRREDAPSERAEAALEMCRAWLSSPLLADLRQGGDLRAELPFLLDLGGAIVHGKMDLHASGGDGPITVIDYKTNALDDGDPSAHMESYEAQRDLYAIAAGSGKRPVRVAFVFLERAGDPVIREFSPPDLLDARAGLESLVAELNRGRFEVTSNPTPELCFDCPARAQLCSSPAAIPNEAGVRG